MFGVDDAALALLASGVISSAGAIYANRQNIKNQMAINAAQIAQMDANNAMQMHMADTAHQREIRDLRLAGLNPILSAGGSGSAVPSLQQARLDAAQVPNPLSGLAESASGIARYMGQQYKANLAQQKATADILNSESRQSSWEASLAKPKADLVALQTQLETNALEDLSTKMVKNSDGSWSREIDPNSEYYKRYKEGMLSDQVIKARQSSRNLYQDILSGINSAERLGSSIMGIRRPSQWLRRK